MHLNLTISQKLKLFINTQTYTHVFFLDSNENNNAQKKNYHIFARFQMSLISLFPRTFALLRLIRRFLSFFLRELLK